MNDFFKIMMSGRTYWGKSSLKFCGTILFKIDLFYDLDISDHIISPVCQRQSLTSAQTLLRLYSFH